MITDVVNVVAVVAFVALIEDINEQTNPNHKLFTYHKVSFTSYCYAFDTRANIHAHTHTRSFEAYI